MRLRSEIPGYMIEPVVTLDRIVAMYICVSCGARFVVELHESPDALEAKPGTPIPDSLRLHDLEHAA